MRGPCWTPITPLRGAFLHADPQWKAQRAFNGIEASAWSDDEVEERIEAQAQKYADRLYGEFGNKFATNPEIAARALNIYLGRKLGEVFGEMKVFVGEPEGGNPDF